MSHLSKSLVARNNELDHLFSTREIVMKEKPRKKKGDSVDDDEPDDLDDDGYRDLPTVGVSKS